MNLADSIDELRQIANVRNDLIAQTAEPIAGSCDASPATDVGHELIAAGMLILAAKVIHWTTKSLSIGHALASSEERRITAVSGKKVVWQRPSLVADQNGQPSRSQYSPRTIRSSRQASRVRPGDAFVRCDQILPERPPSHHAEKSSRRTGATRP